MALVTGYEIRELLPDERPSTYYEHINVEGVRIGIWVFHHNEFCGKVEEIKLAKSGKHGHTKGNIKL